MTPFYGLEPLLPYIPKEWVIWESAAGEHHIVDALMINGQREVIAHDILTEQNYFDDRHVPRNYDCQITNPPFSLKYEWLKRAYHLGKPFALLMPADTLFSGTTRRLFDKYGWQMLLPSQRIDFCTPLKRWDSNAQFTSAWFCHGLPNLAEGLTFCTLNKPKKRKGHVFSDDEMRKPIQKSKQLALFY